MHVLFLTFGDNLSNHTQAHFCIYSLLAQKQNITAIHVMTDLPDFYKSLEQHINIIPVQSTLLKEWEGPHNFFWRVKIKAIEQVCAQHPGAPVLYLDSDTFAYRSLTDLIQEAAQGVARMHVLEKALPDATSKTEKRMWQQIGGKVFGGVTITPAHAMWNAGVILTPNSVNGNECRMALALCDDMCAQNVTRRLIEQYSLAVALKEHYQLKPAADYIAHYWSNKPDWNRFIEQLFIQAGFKQYNFNQITDLIGQTNFNQIPVTKEIPNTNTRLQKLINKWFPPRNVSYLNSIR